MAKTWKPKVDWLAPALLIPYAKNAKVHTIEQIDKIASSISAFGFTQPIVVDKDRVIIAGHGRREAAIRLNLDSVPVVVADHLDEYQAMAARLADNRVADAPWNTELLQFDLGTLRLQEFDLKLTGFDPVQLDRFLLDGEIAPDMLGKGSQRAESEVQAPQAPVQGPAPQAAPNDEKVPELPKEPKSKPGEIYQLGSHRLMCGDSTCLESVGKLLGSEKVELVFTDPPYRMEAEGGSGQVVGAAARKLGEAIKHLCDFDPVGLLKVLPEVFEKGTMNTYIFCNKDLVPDYLNWGLEQGYSFNILFWKKPNAIPLGGSHRPDVEYLLLFRKSATWNNALEGVNYSKCLEFGRDIGTDHPTKKPVDLIINEILISSSKEGSVLDLFGGSGSTLVACEKTNRKAFLMELDPKYCDVIIARWEAMSGQKAITLCNA